MERTTHCKLPTQVDESKLNAQQLKEMGNSLFAARRYNDAISFYGKAIIKNPTLPQFFTNRALCQLKLQRWELACVDCRRAIDMEPGLVKAHFFLGQALMELNLLDEAIKYLQRAHDLARAQMQYFGDEITCLLRAARKRRWNILEERRITQEIELQSYLTTLMLRDKDSAIDALLSSSALATASDDPSSAGETHLHTGTSSPTASSDGMCVDGVDVVSNGGRAAAVLEQRVHEAEASCDHRIALLNDLFCKVDDRRRKREVPDYLCGKISFEILRDPVITPSGVTYDRKDLMEHLQRVGHFDPVTRTELTTDQLIPNLAMKEVVDTFLQENEWAHDC